MAFRGQDDPALDAEIPFRALDTVDNAVKVFVEAGTAPFALVRGCHQFDIDCALLMGPAQIIIGDIGKILRCFHRGRAGAVCFVEIRVIVPAGVTILIEIGIRQDDAVTFGQLREKFAADCSIDVNV